jgi:hypothetical protein
LDTSIKSVILSSELKKIKDSKTKVDNTDVIVQLEDGERFIATFFSYSYLNEINHKHIKSGEYLNGLYFWNKRMILIKECTRDNISLVIKDLIDEGEFQEAFEML